MEEKNMHDNFRNEISREVGTSGSKRKMHWGNIGITSVLGVLVVLSLVQAVQSATVLSKIEPSSAGSPNAGAGANTIAPATTNVQDLPDMVGGC